MTWRCYKCGEKNDEEWDYCKSCDTLREDSEDQELEHNHNNNSLFKGMYNI